jgi:preprotein translocase subunit SecD
MCFLKDNSKPALVAISAAVTATIVTVGKGFWLGEGAVEGFAVGFPLDVGVGV